MPAWDRPSSTTGPSTGSKPSTTKKPAVVTTTTKKPTTLASTTFTTVKPSKPEGVTIVTAEESAIAGGDASTSSTESSIDNDISKVDCTTDGFKPHENCNKFYQCVYNKPLEFTCRPGTVWNQDLKICDWPENSRRSECKRA